MKANKSTQSLYFQRGVIFRKILVVFVFLSLIPVAFSSFLTISTYQDIFDDLEKEGIFIEEGFVRLKQNILIQIFLILLLLIFLIVFASILISRSITRPLSNLVQGIKDVSKGNLEVKFKVKSRDELGELATVSNEMVRKLKEQRRREILMGKLKTEFISIAAHQLRTPLSSVKWILKMVLDGDMGKVSLEQRKFIEKGYSANERMITLVNDLLNISRIEEGRFGFDFSKNDFNKFLKDVIDSFSEQAKRQNVKLNYSPLSSSLIFNFDSKRLKMAVSNLIDNAIRYTLPRGHVDVTVFGDKDSIEVSIKDTGVGIPKSQYYRVFGKFFRGDNVIRMQTEGTGLGLYLAKNIIEKHDGRIWFKSEENQGTTFSFTLPVKNNLL